MRTKRLRLLPSDVVLDFGGYRGDYAAELRRRYRCTVHVFEPVPMFAHVLRDRFDDDAQVTVHEYAVGRRSGTAKLHVEDDATGVFAHGPAVEVSVVSAQTLAEDLPESIALAKINIEGGEFDLLPAMSEVGLMDRIHRLIIQFHNLSDSSVEDRRVCQELLGKTHVKDWDYPFVWESWSKRPQRVVESRKEYFQRRRT